MWLMFGSDPPCSDLVALRRLSIVSSIVACWVAANELGCPFSAQLRGSVS